MNSMSYIIGLTIWNGILTLVMIGVLVHLWRVGDHVIRSGAQVIKLGNALLAHMGLPTLPD